MRRDIILCQFLQLSTTKIDTRSTLGFFLLTAIGFSTRALAQCAVNEGHTIDSFDCCGDLDTRALATNSSVIDLDDSGWLQALKPNSTLLLCGGFDDQYDMLERLSVVDQSIKPQRFSMIRNRSNWANWASNSDLRFPRTYFIDELIQNPKLLREAQVTHWLWKKHSSGGGLGVKAVSLNPDGISSDAPELRRSGDDIIQERLQGHSFSVSYLSSVHGTIMLGAAKAIDLKPHPWSEFIYRGSIAPINDLKPWRASLERFGNTVARSTDWCGLWQADLLVSGNDVYLIEINPRWTASMELIAVSYRFPLVTWHLLCQTCEKSSWREIVQTIELAKRALCVTYRKEILYASQDRTIGNDEVEWWWKRRWIAARPQERGPWYADLTPAGVPIVRGTPVCSMIEAI